ncbi:deoxycytidylate deaminase-like [Lytechinus variegatus]|uniref:deoxycytidylate deaminase-like n=1 Tax=Lytechinus variegatus TaxID=7654 RepID=UPI001BB18904|nr:deoxycytidylate deaminase-like [Lytechinus variegatus]
MMNGSTEKKSTEESHNNNTIFHIGPRKEFLSDDEYFMITAHLTAQRSKDPVTPVGACIVTSDGKLAGTGFNKMPDGCLDDEFPWDERDLKNKYDTKFPYVTHAELNALMEKQGCDVRGGKIYITLFPCNDCAKMIIQAGIKHVFYASDKYRDSNIYLMKASEMMMDSAGVTYTKLRPTSIVISPEEE